MMKTAVLILLFLLTGCATYVTEEGKKIQVIHDGSLELYSDCKQLAVVHGEAGSILSGGDYGLFYATNDARNKAARIADADTLVIADNKERRFGGEFTGIAYNCKSQRARPVQKTTAPEIRKAPATAVPKDDLFEKAKKCQNKGGVWVNNQCVIKID